MIKMESLYPLCCNGYRPILSVLGEKVKITEEMRFRQKVVEYAIKYLGCKVK